MDGIDQGKHVTINDRIEILIEEIVPEREKARAKVTNAQEKQKNRYDKKLKTKIFFEIGDKVLYYEAAKEKQWSGKLRPKWKGPYYIYQVLSNGSYKLRTLDGKILVIPVNRSLLKIYRDR